VLIDLFHIVRLEPLSTHRRSRGTRGS
jgi:hypothetical protein